MIVISIFTSHISSRCYRIGEVFLCVCVCPHSHDRALWPMTLILVWALTLTLARFWIVGQGSRSKVKVTGSENVISRLLPEGNSHVKSLWSMVWLHVMSHYKVLGVISLLLSVCWLFVCVSTHKKKDCGAIGLYNGGTREVHERSGGFIVYVNICYSVV